LPPRGAVVVSDVVNPLLGQLGAAAVFGPQKGATPDDIAAMEAALARFAALVPGSAETPGAGAAGGTGFGLPAWGACLAPGRAGARAAPALAGARSGAVASTAARS